jgi:hypothetical protein
MRICVISLQDITVTSPETRHADMRANIRLPTLQIIYYVLLSRDENILDSVGACLSIDEAFA